MSPIEGERCLIEVVSVVKTEIPIRPAAFLPAPLFLFSDFGAFSAGTPTSSDTPDLSS